MDMGFGQVRAEKGLYFSDNISLEHAINWLTENENDPDIDKPVLLLDYSNQQNHR